MEVFFSSKNQIHVWAVSWAGAYMIQPIAENVNEIKSNK